MSYEDITRGYALGPLSVPARPRASKSSSPSRSSAARGTAAGRAEGPGPSPCGRDEARGFAVMGYLRAAGDSHRADGSPVVRFGDTGRPGGMDDRGPWLTMWLLVVLK